MKLIIPIYVIAIGNLLVGLFDLWIFLSDHTPDIAVYGAIFNMIGITSGLIATALKSQHKRIEQCERFRQNIASPDANNSNE